LETDVSPTNDNFKNYKKKSISSKFFFVTQVTLRTIGHYWVKSTKLVIACLHEQNKSGFFTGPAFIQPIRAI